MAKKPEAPSRTKLTAREQQTIELVRAGKIVHTHERMNRILEAAKLLPAAAIVNSVRNLERMGLAHWDDEAGKYVLSPGKEA